MSHKGTNWAIQQRGLKPATKIVLWHLCDRHNPDFGCFPTQARLADDAEMSVSALNEHLAKLEELGLIHRVRAHDPRTHRRQATRYILGFEDGFPQEPVPETGDGFAGTEHEQNADPSPESGHGAISGFCRVPSPDFGQSHLRNPETNLVREPLREPVKEEEDAQARETEFDRFFAELLNALGLSSDGPLPAWWKGWPAREHVRRWRDDLGLTEDNILETATATRREHPAPPDGPKALDRAMERAAQRVAQATAGRPPARSPRRQPNRAAQGPASPDDVAAFYAGLVNSDRFLPANTISNATREAMLARGLVTVERLRMRGVR
ncbi:GntR family transcriptional regulator [Defluviimonas sp. 20V17]|uniref:Helix-turn-helix domain-containing protein n=1 Tax=Allgaiera indica TaxID=765699 RepID=A0AAN4UUR0_9RHOB|nr:helix-turn-helix domain-containing protein [Allgaiera indica]KDB04987.1 GntR family transcriptional regulator [Defluviimonas sp. 20V17]GHE05422.1 helix-turn-helix domain-containing protein [Allgaiera indica]SDX72414.1 Helix-turn-helix domain-containing protein [Allgaiera indica]